MSILSSRKRSHCPWAYLRRRPWLKTPTRATLPLVFAGITECICCAPGVLRSESENVVHEHTFEGIRGWKHQHEPPYLRFTPGVTRCFVTGLRAPGVLLGENENEAHEHTFKGNSWSQTLSVACHWCHWVLSNWTLCTCSRPRQRSRSSRSTKGCCGRKRCPLRTHKFQCFRPLNTCGTQA